METKTDVQQSQYANEMRCYEVIPRACMAKMKTTRILISKDAEAECGSQASDLEKPLTNEFQALQATNSNLPSLFSRESRKIFDSRLTVGRNHHIVDGDPMACSDPRLRQLCVHCYV
jgi:prophage DNA circulation protein